MTTDSVAAEAVEATSPDIASTVASVRRAFATGRTRSVEWRKQQLLALEKLVTENEAAIADALEKDLGRKPFEAWLADIASTASEAHDAAKNVGKWTKRQHRRLELAQFPGRGWIEYEPYGTVLVIGAWNFPFALTLGPAVGAIAAGNAVVLKPSEVSPASSALMAELVPQYLDRDAIVVIEGDGAVSQELIAQGFDKLCFTGGTEIGRKVYEGAAKHLTPGHPRVGRQEPGDRRGRRRHRRRRQADRVDQAGQLRPDLHRTGLRHCRRQDPRRARRQDQGGRDDVRGRRPGRQARSSTSATSTG